MDLRSRVLAAVELYCLAKDLGTHFVVRTVVDRLAGSGDHTVKSEMREAPSAGTHSIQVRTDDTVELVTLDIQYKRIHVCPPIGKQKCYPSLDLTVIHATEIGTPSRRKPILWKLVTDLEVGNLQEALEKIRWYAMRWKIEVFHKILKSGCRAEDAKLRTADRLANLVALFCIVSWRVLWMTMVARSDPEANPALAFTATEIITLDTVIANTGNRGAKPATLELYLIKLARLGGYLARKADPPPGDTAIWRGLRRLVSPTFKSGPNSPHVGNCKLRRMGTLVCTGNHEARAALLTDAALAERSDAVELVRWQNDEPFRLLVVMLAAILPLRKPSELEEEQCRASRCYRISPSVDLSRASGCPISATRLNDAGHCAQVGAGSVDPQQRSLTQAAQGSCSRLSSSVLYGRRRCSGAIR